MKTTVVRDMLGTLKASVAEIMAKASTPEEQEALLKRSFDECGEAMDAEVEGILAKFTPPAGSYEGLGTVGRLAAMASAVAEHARAIKAGVPAYETDLTKSDDPASAEVADALDTVLHLSEVALRVGVNEQVMIHDGEELGKGECLITVPSAEDPSDSDLAIVVKTHLPEELAKFATDPAILNEMRVDASVDLALIAGVPARRLEKLFGIEGLAKAFGAGKPEDDEEDDAEGDEGDEGGEGGPPQEGEGDGGEGGGQMVPQGGMGGDEGAADSPFDVAGRLCAALMIQLAHCQELFEGAAGDIEGEVDPEMEGEQPPPAEGAEGGAPPAEGEEMKKKPPFMKSDNAGALAKREDVLTQRVDDLGKGLAGVTELLKAMASQPAAPKGAVMAVAVSKEKDGLAKADGLTTDDPKDVKGPDGYSENDLEKMDPGARATLEIKRAFARGH